MSAELWDSLLEYAFCSLLSESSLRNIFCFWVGSAKGWVMLIVDYVVFLLKLLAAMQVMPFKMES